MDYREAGLIQSKDKTRSKRTANQFNAQSSVTNAQHDNQNRNVIIKRDLTIKKLL